MKREKKWKDKFEKDKNFKEINSQIGGYPEMQSDGVPKVLELLDHRIDLG